MEPEPEHQCVPEHGDDEGQKIATLQRELAESRKREQVLQDKLQAQQSCALDCGPQFTIPEAVPEPAEIREITSGGAHGHSLAQLMAVLHATCIVVSTPEHGPGPREGEYQTPVMSGIERLCGYVSPKVHGSYDFKGSAAQQDCAMQVPDREIDADGWKLPDIIKTTQWFR